MNPKYILEVFYKKNTDNKLENLYDKFKNVAEYLNLVLLMKASLILFEKDNKSFRGTKRIQIKQ